jgi:two-component system chemotaxis sensor kinase CheA
MTDDAIALTPELLDDFFAECDEQLSTIRAQLLALEQSPSENRGATLETLYRSVHSFKGNAAIVGLAPAEQLAHVTEGLLRSWTRGEVEPNDETIDLLAQITRCLEETISAFRAKQPLPNPAELLGRVGKYVPVSAAPLEPPPSHAVQRSHVAPTPNWRATFRPQAALDRRGVNVNSVRQRLAALGSITAAKPTVEPGGAIRFDFFLALAHAPADPDAWASDGVTWEQEQHAAAAGPEHATLTPDTFFRAHSPIVRVDLSRLDELMRIAGDLVIQRSRLQDRIVQASAGTDTTSLQEVNLALARSLRELRAAVMRARMVPVTEIFSRLPFIVRDLTRGTDKGVRLVLEGQDTEIDKYLVERLKEPLLHLVRNAVSHGLETRAERGAAGKPAEGTLLLRASASGDAVEIRIRDDGRGISSAIIAARARAAALPVPEELDASAVLRLICTPGFSTRDEVDRAAGRGVGMAVVDSTLRELGGALSLSTEPGRFTEFTLRLPLTLSITDTFVVAAGSQLCAVPQTAVDEVVQMQPDEVRRLSGGEVGPHRGTLLPLIRLRRLFGMPPGSNATLPVLVLKTDGGASGLVVDRVVGHREVVVRSMSDPLLRVPGVSGATELGDGRPILILDAGTLPEAARRSHPLLPLASPAP